jgi:hypothetical protein
LVTGNAGYNLNAHDNLNQTYREEAPKVYALGASNDGLLNELRFAIKPGLDSEGGQIIIFM